MIAANYTEFRAHLKKYLDDVENNNETYEQIIESYPHISHESILAALSFAAKALKADIIYPIEGGFTHN